MNKRFWLPVLGLMITTLANAQRPSTYESGEKEKAEAQETKSNEMMEAGDISVTALKMVSEKCQ